MRMPAGVIALALACAPAYADKRKPADAKPFPPAGRRAPNPRPPGPLGNAGPNARPPALQRLQQMSPDERQKMLDRLPPERARRLQDRLDAYDQMTPGERQRLNRQYDWFSRLPPEKQENLRKAFQRYTKLPPQRQEAVRQEFNAMCGMTASERSERTRSEAFRSRYSKEERRVIEEMSGAVAE